MSTSVGVGHPYNMKTMGILTGISHVSGADYYVRINDLIQSQLPYKFAGHSSRMLIYSLELEEYVELLHYNKPRSIEFLSNGTLFYCWLCVGVCCYKTKKPKQNKKIGANKLIRGGADFLVIASNTAHVAFDRITELNPYFPILHIADCVANELKHQNIKKIGLIGTIFTMTGKSYRKINTLTNKKHERIQSNKNKMQNEKKAIIISND